MSDGAKDKKPRTVRAEESGASRISAGSGNLSASSSLDPSVVFLQDRASTSARPSTPGAVVKKKSGIRGRFSLQRLLYSPLLNRRRKNSSDKGASRTQQAAPAINNNNPRHSKTSVSKGSIDESALGPNHCQYRYGATGSSIPGGPGTSSIGFDSLSAASFSSSTCDQKREKGTQECPLCLGSILPDRLLTMINCHHAACKDCLSQYVLMAISEYQGNVHCFECAEYMHPADVRVVIKNESYMSKYEDLMVRRVLASDPDARWCPAPDCSFAVVAAGCASCPKLKCDRPGCGMNFCYNCKAEWHPNQTCDAARAEREPRMRLSSRSFSYDVPYPFLKEQIKPCPVCRSLIMKQEDGSCNHMVCTVCATEFCWLCMKQISDLHYLSPSGCTFWGKKPWSRKKKILWQLGMLIGAPVGIALIAGIAVPAIVIGIPVWVGRRIYQNSHNTRRYRRNMIIVAGVMSSVLVSPVLAGAAVGFGVPMLLAYVYGVVPVSLCRSGVCGITTSASGVRLDFDEDNENGEELDEIKGATSGRLAAAKGGDEDDDEEDDGSSSLRGRLASGACGGIMAGAGEGSSVGPGMSMTLSLGDGSSCHTVDRPDETASLKALAGSIASSASRGQRMEVMADVTSHVSKRNSISSESASGVMSMISSDRHSDGRSGVIAVSDDRASNVALAGSILSYRLTNESGYHHGGEVTSLKSMDAIGAHGGASGGGGYSGTNASVSPVSSFSTGDELFYGGRRSARSSARKGYYMERQLSVDSGSLEERVRFDENVSFIDDLHGASDCQILEDVEAEELEATKYMVETTGSSDLPPDFDRILARIITDGEKPEGDSAGSSKQATVGDGVVAVVTRYKSQKNGKNSGAVAGSVKSSKSTSPTGSNDPHEGDRVKLFVPFSEPK